MSMEWKGDSSEYVVTGAKATEQKLKMAVSALQTIRDSTYRSALMLRAIAAESLEHLKEKK